MLMQTAATVNTDNFSNPPPASAEKNAFASNAGSSTSAATRSEVAIDELRRLQQSHEALRFQYDGINRLLEAQSQEFRAAIEERDSVLNLNRDYSSRILELELRVQTLMRENRSTEQLNQTIKELKAQVETLTERLVHEQDARRQTELALAQASDRLRRSQQAPKAAADPSPSASQAAPLSLSAQPPQENQVSNLAQPGTGGISNTLKKTLTTLSTSVPQLVKRPNSPKLVAELCQQIGVVAEETAKTGILPLHQLATALRIMLEDFQKTPTLMVQSRMRTLGQAFDLLLQICQNSKENLGKIKGVTPPNILAADDDNEVLGILESELGSLGMSLCSTSDSGKVLAALQSQRFNLVLLDIGMTDFNGLELCARIRKLEGYARTPIIFLTGLTTTDLRDQAIAIGGNDFVSKPFHAAEVGLKSIYWAIRDQL